METGLVDTHAHLTSEALAGDTAGVLERACATGVTHVITIGTDLADARRALGLAESYQNVFVSLGIHPHEAAKVTDEDFKLMREIAANSRVVAWGEIGLDYHYDFADRNSQHAAFTRQLEIAKELALPVVVHCREAIDDAVSILREVGMDGARVVFHCFNGTVGEARTLADHGWRISFTGIVTYRKSIELQSIARECPLEWLMIETDAPYLSPEPVRSRRPNEPAHLHHTAGFLAQLRGMSLGEITHVTTSNANKFFGLKL